jgi:potassium efflux system protein
MTRAISLCLSLIFCLNVSSIAQNDSTKILKADSSSSLITNIATLDSLFIFPDSTKAVQPKKSNKIGSILNQLITSTQQHTIELNQVKLDLADALDTVEMSIELPKIQAFAERIKDQSTNNEGNYNLRYLQGMDNLIVMVSDRNEKFDDVIKKRIKTLLEVGGRLEEIKNDTLLNVTLRDTTLVTSIAKELNSLRTSIKNVDSAFLAQEIIIARFQAKISHNTIQFLELRQLLNSNKKLLEHKIWTKEINYPWESPSYEKDSDIRKVIAESTSLNLRLMGIYIQKTQGIFLLAIVLLVGAFITIKHTITIITKEKEFASLILNRILYFEKKTFWSTLLILLPLFLLIFSQPPLVFVSILSLLMVISCTFLIRKQFGETLHNYWLIFLIPYIVLAFSGIHWRVAYQERWFVLFSSLIFIVMGILVWRDMNSKNVAGAKLIKYAAIFMILMESFAFLANILGRFNLAKSYAVNGSITFYRSVCLYLFVQVSLEAVYLLIEYSKKENDGFTSYFDFQDLQKRMKGFLSIFAIAIWIYGILWSLGYFDAIYTWFTDFLSKERILGETHFQFGSILLFLVILYIASFLANNIAYFASIKDQKTTLSRKQRLGSSILLIRLAVLIVGFFIGMAAAKIPFDNVAIVLGALSVGIGFGLQTIINNLVSGIILAFERPIQIGDEIQVGVNAGTVKDVGIRASKIQAYDGSEIVIPNGDLLSQSLINWTLSDKKRRVELIIGVGYGSDMKLVKSVLEEVLTGERILKAPTPHVYMQTFNDSSVDFRVLFWVESMDIWIDVRAEVMSTIFEKFAENNIEIPFPKRDLYLKSVPSNWQEKVSKPGEDISPKKLDSGPEDISKDENKKSSEE